MNENESKVIELLNHYKDDVRYPLVVDCADWDDKIRPALDEVLQVIPHGDPSGTWNFLVTFMEAIYCMGYERGKREETLTFQIIEGSK